MDCGWRFQSAIESALKSTDAAIICLLFKKSNVFLKTLNKWIRLDARGNKIGVDAQFSLEEEKFSFSVNEKFDEKDYPIIFVKPNLKTIAVLREHTDALEMYKHYLPASI